MPGESPPLDLISWYCAAGRAALTLTDIDVNSNKPWSSVVSAGTGVAPVLPLRIGARPLYSDRTIARAMTAFPVYDQRPQLQARLGGQANTILSNLFCLRCTEPISCHELVVEFDPQHADIGPNAGFVFITSDNPSRKVLPTELCKVSLLVSALYAKCPY